MTELVKEKEKNSKTWTLISKELEKKFPLNPRTAEQCRQRWKGVLLPSRKISRWTDEEESILFSNHLSLGNRWKDLASFLPGRTEYDVKNHFYSKFRGYVNQILKEIKREHVLENKGIDQEKYNQRYVVELVKKQNFHLFSVDKEMIIRLIENDFKGNSNENISPKKEIKSNKVNEDRNKINNCQLDSNNLNQTDFDSSTLRNKKKAPIDEVSKNQKQLVSNIVPNKALTDNNRKNFQRDDCFFHNISENKELDSEKSRAQDIFQNVNRNGIGTQTMSSIFNQFQNPMQYNNSYYLTMFPQYYSSYDYLYSNYQNNYFQLMNQNYYNAFSSGLSASAQQDRDSQENPVQTPRVTINNSVIITNNNLVLPKGSNFKK